MISFAGAGPNTRGIDVRMCINICMGMYIGMCTGILVCMYVYGCGDTGLGYIRHRCMYVYRHVCTYLFSHVVMDRCIRQSIELCFALFVDMRVDMCVDMCVNMCVDMAWAPATTRIIDTQTVLHACLLIILRTCLQICPAYMSPHQCLHTCLYTCPHTAGTHRHYGRRC